MSVFSPPIPDAVGADIAASDAAMAPLSVLIVDDSAVARAVLTQVIEGSGDFIVTRSVGTVAAALAVLAQGQVDFVLLDLALPDVDGLTGLPNLIAAARGAPIVIVSSSATKGAVASIRALALGAADTVLKPAPGDSTSAFGQGLLTKLRRLSDFRAEPAGGRRWPPPAPAPTSTAPTTTAPTSTASPSTASPSPSLPPSSPSSPQPSALTPVTGARTRFDIVAIGASTGGIHALNLLLRELPPSFDTPILVTQHLPVGFMSYFATQLSLMANRPCDVAVDRMRIRRGRVILAPGDAHMRCVALPDGGAAIRLSSEPATSGCLPSVDPMLASLADVFGTRAVAVVLSGMGRDGAEGAASVHQAGGCVVVQDAASSVVWGMPGSIAETGIPAAVLPPAALGHLIASGRRP